MLDLSASSSLRTAFADESFSEHPTAGFYVLAAVVLDSTSGEEVREAMLGLRQRLRGRRANDKLHWNHLARGQREQAVKQVAALACLHVVTIGSPVPQRRQERARAACLTRLVLELHGMGVRQLLMEAREQELNRRDVHTVAGARFLLPKGSSFHVDHDHGTGEPILWVADLVAGAVRAHRLGDPTSRDALDNCVHETDVVTDC